MSATQTLEPPLVTPPIIPLAPARKRPPRALILTLVAVVVAIGAFFGVRYLLYASSHESTDDAKIDADQVTVTSKISERVAQIAVDTNQSVQRGQLLIQLDNTDEKQRVAAAAATVAALRAQARAAQANVALIRDQQSAQVAQNRGSVAQAQAGIASAAETVRSARGQIAAAQAAVAAAAAQLQAAQDGVPAAREALRKAQADLGRTQSLAVSGDVARSQLDAARATAAGAQANERQAQAAVATAQANLVAARQKLIAQQAATGSSQAQVDVQQGSLTTAEGKLAESATPNRIVTQQATADAAQAQVVQAQSQLRTAQDQLANTKIFAPIAGYVGAKNVEVGQTLSPGQSILVIVPSGHVYVTANYKETQLGKMRVGQPAQITVDAYKGVTFAGRLEAIAPASQNTFSIIPAQNATGNFVKVTQRVPVRIAFDHLDPAYPLRPGMSVETAVKVK